MSGGMLANVTTSPSLRDDRNDALALTDVTVRFGGISALSDVSLGVPSGQLCGLIGANGAGKTTLFDVISGLRSPYSGTVTLHGTDVTKWSVQRRARFGLRRTFQRVQVFGWLSVEDNLLVASEWRGGGGGVLGDLVALPTRGARERDRREKAEAVLERCGLLDICLLYTSDAADERSSVDLGGRRIIKKKTKTRHKRESTLDKKNREMKGGTTMYDITLY